jgi:hypothetical protein
MTLVDGQKFRTSCKVMNTCVAALRFTINHGIMPTCLHARETELAFRKNKKSVGILQVRIHRAGF